jgi:hypothetical protein
MIRNRKYGRKADSSFGGSASHILKIGWDIRARGAERPQPQRLAGFIVCRNSIDPDGGLVIDMKAMRRLGDYTPEGITAAIKAGVKAPANLLPHSIAVLIPNDAVRDADGAWTFPSVLAEEYACFDRSGLFCSGNGQEAERRQADHTRRKLACNPVGKSGVEPKDFCEFSVKKLCHAHSRLTVIALYTAADGNLHPLADIADARFRLDTASEYGAMRMTEALSLAAERLNGKIAGLTGTLTVGIERKRHEGGVGITPQIHLILNEVQIRQRERAMRPIPAALAAPGADASALAAQDGDTADFSPGAVEVNGGDSDPPLEVQPESPIPDNQTADAYQPPDGESKAETNTVPAAERGDHDGEMVPIPGDIAAMTIADVRSQLADALAEMQNQPGAPSLYALTCYDGKPGIKQIATLGKYDAKPDGDPQRAKADTLARVALVRAWTFLGLIAGETTEVLP